MLVPSMVLGLGTMAYLTRLMRSSMLEIVNSDFVRTARAKGLPPTRIFLKHQLRNAILPVITVLGPAIAAITTGGFVVELVFAIPGLGRYFVEAVQQLDYTVIMGTTVFYGAFLVLMVIVVDLHLWADRSAGDARMSAVSSGISPADFRAGRARERRRRRSRGRRCRIGRTRGVGCSSTGARSPRSYLIAALALFTVAGPWIWRVDPAAQDVDQVSSGPSLPATAIIVEPYTAWSGVSAEHSGSLREPCRTIYALRNHATTQAVRLVWNAVSAPADTTCIATSTIPSRIARSACRSARSSIRLGSASRTASTSSRAPLLVLGCPRSIGTAPKRPTTRCSPVDVERVTSAEEAVALGWIADASAVAIGDEIRLPYHPLGTDYLGRDMLARLMHGARVSLFIGVVAPLLFVTDRDHLRQHRWLRRRPPRPAADALRRLRGGAAVSAVHDSLQDRVRDRPGRERRLPDARRARRYSAGRRRARLVRGQILQIRQEGVHRRIAALGRKDRLSRVPAHDSEHDGRDPRNAHVRGPERDLHRSLPLVHRHGRRAADAVVGQHVERRHLAPCCRIRTSSIFPALLHQHHGAGVQSARRRTCATRSTCACEDANERGAEARKRSHDSRSRGSARRVRHLRRRRQGRARRRASACARRRRSRSSASPAAANR